MAKELNPELFGERRKSSSSSSSEITPNYGREAESMPNFLNVDRQILEVRQQLALNNEEMKKISSQIAEVSKATHLKFERLQQQVQRLEQAHNGLAQETIHKMGHLNQKITDRKSVDTKIQEMVDRYTNVIKSFEVRMHHLQKLLADKEAQMVAAQTALNEAKMEIGRLKRM